jgi:hypothetical protein
VLWSKTLLLCPAIATSLLMHCVRYVMSKSIAYALGRVHGLRGLPMCTFFTPTGCWEDTQYRQGYIDGSVALQNDIERETK